MTGKCDLSPRRAATRFAISMSAIPFYVISTSANLFAISTSDSEEKSYYIATQDFSLRSK
jgi:hypothetical protein